MIIGASGDLASRKLIPALFSLYSKEGLPDPFSIVGCARTEMTDEQFREKMKAHSLEKLDEATLWQKFSSCLHYRSIEYDSLDSYRDLAGHLDELDIKGSTGGNRIFYLALPMFLYQDTARLLGESGLSVSHTTSNGRDFL